MKTILAEKPSVAREIARLVGATDKREGYLEGNGYYVTWAFGHLIQLALPEEYGFVGFVREQLPILPSPFRLTCRKKREGREWVDDPGVIKQLRVIDTLFKKSDSLIECTDAGREGEYIFRLIYNWLHCRKPFQRLWVSSLTDRALRDGFRHLRNGHDYDTLYLAAKARSEADWLVGCNASRALSIAAGEGIYSLGRVQTPTLCMICERYLQHIRFVPVPYWQVRITLQKGGTSFTALTVERFDSKFMAQKLLSDLQTGRSAAKVKTVERREVIQPPPLLFDLTSLQKRANTLWGYTADRTLSIAQKLYESKLITYPRTGSCYIPQDLFEEIPARIMQQTAHPKFGTVAIRLTKALLTRGSVDDAKVTDHHALLPTEVFPSIPLSAEERSIYDLITARMLEAFSTPCTKDNTTVTFSAEGVDFQVKGSVIKRAGWCEVWQEQEKPPEGEEHTRKQLPPLEANETMEIRQSELLEKETQPLPLHTESSLLAAMESCGKQLEDETQRQVLREVGIGTPATRASIIETLLTRGYIRREKKTLLPTDKGLAVYEVVRDREIGNVQLTGEWETKLAQIEAGSLAPEQFNQEIVHYTTRITEELLQLALTVREAKSTEGEGSKNPACPACGKPLALYQKVVKCRNESCGFLLFRTVAGKHLTDKQTIDLLIKKKTGVIRGFTGKSGKPFEASLLLDEQGKIKFQFPTR